MGNILIGERELLTYEIALVSSKSTNYQLENVILNENGEMTGLLAAPCAFFKRKKYIPAESIVQFAKNAVIVDCMRPIKPSVIRKMKFTSNELFGKTIRTEDGEFLGVLSDIYINTSDMSVMAIEMSCSLFEDLFGGRMVIPGSINISKCGDIIVSNEQYENRLHNAKGLINVID